MLRKPSREEWYRRLEYTPRVSQRAMDQAIDAGHRYISYFAFPRCGKSYGAAKSVGLRLLERDHHMWIVAPTYPLGSKEFGYIYNDLNQLGLLQWADPKYGAGCGKAFDVRSGSMYAKFPWGAFLEVKSADQPTGLRAEELDTLILAEASGLNPDVYQRHLYTRTNKRFGLVLVPTTPMGKNWIYDQFRAPSRETDSEGLPNPLYNPLYWSCVVSADPELVDPADWDLADIYEPNIYSLDTVARARLELPPPIFTEQFGGGFASYAGRVLPYDSRVHRCKPFNIPDHWTHIVGWDHGSSPSKTAILIGSYAPDGTLFWWAELYTSGWTIRQYWKWVEQTLGPNKRASVIAVDPSAKQVRVELSNLNISSDIPRDKQIEAGVIRLTQLLNLHKMKFFENCCKDWEREANRMEWDEKNPKKILNDHLYHSISATRYASLIPVPMPVDAEAAPITADRATNKAEFWKQVRAVESAERQKLFDRRFESRFPQDTPESAQLAALSADILEDGGPFEVSDDFDVEAYFSQD